MGKLDSDPVQSEKAKNFIQQDYARVDIYYQTLNVKDIKQSAVIGVSVLSSLLSKYSDANLNSFLMNNFSLTTTVNFILPSNLLSNQCRLDRAS